MTSGKLLHPSGSISCSDRGRGHGGVPRASWALRIQRPGPGDGGGSANRAQPSPGRQKDGQSCLSASRFCSNNCCGSCLRKRTSCIFMNPILLHLLLGWPAFLSVFHPNSKLSCSGLSTAEPARLVLGIMTFGVCTERLPNDGFLGRHVCRGCTGPRRQGLTLRAGPRVTVHGLGVTSQPCPAPSALGTFLTV